MPNSPRPSASRNSLEKLFPILLLVWAGFVFYHYFDFRTLLDFSFLSGFFQRLEFIDLRKFLGNALESAGILALGSFVFFTLWRWGRALHQWMGLGLEILPLRFAVEMALGILFLNGLWLGLGLNLLWFKPLMTGLGLILGGIALVDFFRNPLGFQKLPRLALPGGVFLGLGFFGFLFLLFSIGQSFSPEIFFDGLVYHLAALSFWKFNHGVTDFHSNLYAHFPFGGELYLLNGFFFQGSEAAKFLNALGSGLCALAAAGWVWEEAGREPGYLTWGWILSFPLVSLAVWTTQNDVLLAFFIVLFFYALSRWGQERDNGRWAVLAGLMGGGAFAVKYTAVLGLAGGLAALCLVKPGIFRRRHWPLLGIIKLLVILSALPWLLKNDLFTGNPFYPYFSHWMGGITISPIKMAALMGDHQSSWDQGFSFRRWLGLVLTRDLDKTIGPYLFLFIPFLFLPRKTRFATAYMGVVSLLLLAGGFLVSHQLRLMIPAFISCFIFMALFLSDLQRPVWTKTWSWLVLALGAAGFLSLCRLTAHYYQADQIWFGQKTSLEYLSESPTTRTYMDLTKAAQGLPDNDRLLIAGDARALYYPRPFVSNSVFDDQVLELLARREKDAAGIRQGLRKMGVEDLVVAGGEGLRLSRQYAYYVLSQAEWKKLDDFIQAYTELIYLKDMNGIYRLRPAPIERKKPILNLVNLFNVLAAKPPK